MTSARHIVIVVSDVDKSLAFEWIARELKNDYRLSFLLLNPGGSSLETYLEENGHSYKRLKVEGKRSFPRVFWQLFLFFVSTRPDIVHAHLLTAQILALPSAFLAGVRNRIYTRHTSDFHHKYHPKGVLYDKLSNLFATTIISISQATHTVLCDLEKVSESKIETIHHGFDFSVFTNVDPDRIAAVKRRWQIGDTSPVIGVISRHIEWKGIQYIIPAFLNLLGNYPNALLVLANAQGPYHQKILEALKEIPPANFRIIPFEEDIGALYRCFDIYVHTPVDEICEAFGQTYVEASASGVPSIFTLSGVAREVIIHETHAWVVDFRNSDQIYRGMLCLLSDESLRNRLAEAARLNVIESFSLETMIGKLRILYGG